MLEIVSNSDHAAKEKFYRLFYINLKSRNRRYLAEWNEKFYGFGIRLLESFQKEDLCGKDLEYEQLRISYLFIKQNLRATCPKFQRRETEFWDYVFWGLKSNEIFCAEFIADVLQTCGKLLSTKKIDSL
jgi:hypothetical protein